MSRTGHRSDLRLVLGWWQPVLALVLASAFAANDALSSKDESIATADRTPAATTYLRVAPVRVAQNGEAKKEEADAGAEEKAPTAQQQGYGGAHPFKLIEPGLSLEEKKLLIPLPGEPRLKDLEQKLLRAILPVGEEKVTVTGVSTDALDSRSQVRREELRQPPFSAVGLLLVEYGANRQSGTGFLIAPDVVLTAAHVLSSPQFGLATRVTFAPGCAIDPASEMPDPRLSQVVGPEWLRVSRAWSGGHTQIESDYGVILLPDAALYKNCGRLPIDVREPSFLNGHAASRSTQFFVVGFPAEKAFQSMWIGRGRLRNASKFSVRHLIDSMPGQSGGPLFTIVRDAATGANAAAVLAIHSRPNLEGNYNEARLLDERAVEEIQSWIDSARQLSSRSQPLQ